MFGKYNYMLLLFFGYWQLAAIGYRPRWPLALTSRAILTLAFCKGGALRGAGREDLLHQGAGQATKKETDRLVWRNGFFEESAEALGTPSVGETDLE